MVGKLLAVEGRIAMMDGVPRRGLDVVIQALRSGPCLKSMAVSQKGETHEDLRSCEPSLVVSQCLFLGWMLVNVSTPTISCKDHNIYHHASQDSPHLVLKT